MKAAFIVFDNMTSLDFIGFYDPLTRLKTMKFLDDFEWIRTAQNVPLKISVCTCALLLGAAGFLKGKRATTHPGAYQELEPYCATVAVERIVDEGGIVTGSGVSASIDLGLHVVQRLAGANARARIAKQMDYPYC